MSNGPQQSGTGIARLLTRVTPVNPDTSINDVGELFLQKEYAGLLSLPVVKGGMVIGSISRYQMIEIFMSRFGRELYGNRPVTHIMNAAPLQVGIDEPLEAAALHVASNIRTPISEDFIVSDKGHYLGVGVVLDLLRAMEQRVAASTASLAEAYQQLKASQAQLVQSEKMASLGQMVAGVAHEINTPLGYVRNNVEVTQSVFEQLRSVLGDHELLLNMMASEEPDEEAIHAQLLKASAASADLRESRTLEDTEALLKDTLFGADQIKELVVNLRNFSRLDQARLAEVNLNESLEQTLVIARNVLKGRVEIIRRLENIPPVSCSPSQINQVFLNLISNAAQAIEHDAGRLLLKTEADKEFVHVSIQDNGKGIAQENLQKIFDPFFTTKPIGQGTGLGLSICYQIVQAHGGNIRVASIPGKGSRFVVSLPIAPAIPQAPTQAIAA
ncbi:MAG: CBS domain-containing protein [Rhizobium sp.]|nr:MAG: CBS domain-containing protein [Rhizobium sp.]